MKRTLTLTLTMAALTLTLACFSPQAEANEITGSIGFGSLGVNIFGGTDLASASSFSVDSPFITTETGIYSGVPLLTSITFNGFQFNPPVGSVTPLWTFDQGGISYSFDATSVTASYNATLRQWDIGGDGIAMATGYTATEGTWNVNLSQSGASVVFDSSAASAPAPSVPDGGSTILFMGGAMIGLAEFARRVRY